MYISDNTLGLAKWQDDIGLSVSAEPQDIVDRNKIKCHHAETCLACKQKDCFAKVR